MDLELKGRIAAVTGTGERIHVDGGLQRAV